MPASPRSTDDFGRTAPLDVASAPGLRRRRIAAMILAAGYSSRMNAFKPLLSLNGRSTLEGTIRLFQDADIEEIWVVLGHRAEELRPVAESAGARTVLNPRFDEGMFTSIRAGTAVLPAAVDGCFVLPVDTPLVRPQTIRQLSRAFEGLGHRIFYPVFAGRRGHPPLIACDILRQSQGCPGPLSALLAAHQEQACDLAVADEAIHLDMDTTADYIRLRDLAESRDIPSTLECEAILACFSASSRLVDHCRAVASTALCLASALRENGVPLDLRLVNAGALLHDLAKGRPHHAEAAAAYLCLIGFPQVAAVVGCHMDLEFSRGQLDEAAIVFLADKLIHGTEPMSLEQRLLWAQDGFRDDRGALAAARRRLATAQSVAAAVEGRLGRPLPEFLQDVSH